MKTWKAHIKISGISREVRIEAKTAYDAKMLLEAQYGKGTVIVYPVEIR